MRLLVAVFVLVVACLLLVDAGRVPDDAKELAKRDVRKAMKSTFAADERVAMHRANEFHKRKAQKLEAELEALKKEAKAAR